MKVTTKRGDLYIEFRHVAPLVTTGKMDSKTRVDPTFTNQGDAGTYCSIKREDKNGTVIAQAHSIIHPLDMYSFNKSKGRRISLAKALNNLFPGRSQKDQRELVWNAYHSR